MNIYNFISISSVLTQQKQRQHFWTNTEEQRLVKASCISAQITPESFKCGIACTQSARFNVLTVLKQINKKLTLNSLDWPVIQMWAQMHCTS